MRQHGFHWNARGDAALLSQCIDPAQAMCPTDKDTHTQTDGQTDTHTHAHAHTLERRVLQDHKGTKEGGGRRLTLHPEEWG